MKQLTIPEQHDIDIGEYAPACEGFISKVKELFFKKPEDKNSIDSRVKELKSSENLAYSKITKELEQDLANTYGNSEWISANLTDSKELITVKALVYANVNKKQITTPKELVSIATNMVKELKGIASTESPFIRLRRKLCVKIESNPDPIVVDKIWLDNEKQLIATASDRYRQKHKNPFPAFGTDEKTTWPVNYKEKNAGGFVELSTYSMYKTDGSFEKPSLNTHSDYVQAIHSLIKLGEELKRLFEESEIPYWDGLNVEYDELQYGDEVFDNIACGQNGELHHLVWSVEDIVGHLIVGLYIAMFDKSS